MSVNSGDMRSLFFSSFAWLPLKKVCAKVCVYKTKDYGNQPFVVSIKTRIPLSGRLPRPLMNAVFLSLTNYEEDSTKHQLSGAEKEGSWYIPVNSTFTDWTFFCRVHQQDCPRLLDITQVAPSGCDKRLEFNFDRTRSQVEGHGSALQSHEQNWRDVGRGHILFFGRHGRKGSTRGRKETFKIRQKLMRLKQLWFHIV